MTYQVNWDNGTEACGTFDEIFDTEESAEAFGESWRNEMCAVDSIDPDDDSEGTYSYEVIEIEDEDEDDDGAEEAAYYEELNRGYTQDRI